MLRKRICAHEPAIDDAACARRPSRRRWSRETARSLAAAARQRLQVRARHAGAEQHRRDDAVEPQPHLERRQLRPRARRRSAPRRAARPCVAMSATSTARTSARGGRGVTAAASATIARPSRAPACSCDCTIAAGGRPCPASSRATCCGRITVSTDAAPAIVAVRAERHALYLVHSVSMRCRCASCLCRRIGRRCAPAPRTTAARSGWRR